MSIGFPAPRTTGAPDEAALWAARARAQGPLTMPASVAAPDGFRRLLDPGGTQAQWLPVGPDEVTPAALRDLRLALPTPDHRHEASRVLAVCLRCCWADLASEPWPGRETTVATVLAVLAELLPTRLPQTHHRFAAEAFRQLTDSGWLRWEERAGTIRLGPRVAGWPQPDLETLRELCRTLPPPPELPALPAPPGREAAGRDGARPAVAGGRAYSAPEAEAADDDGGAAGEGS